MFIAYLFIATHFLPVSELFILSTDDSDRTIVHRIFVSNGGQWGDWAKPEFCPNGTYAKGWQLKSEYNQGDGDDTALNAIRLDCYARQPSGHTDVHVTGTTPYYFWTTTFNGYPISSVASGEGPFGAYYFYNARACGSSPDDFFTAFKLQVEPDQGISGDDTAANNIAFKCRDFGNGTEYEIYPTSATYWGDWSTYSSSCPDNSAICGLSTKIEGDQNIGAIHIDDTALNDVVFYCCS